MPKKVTQVVALERDRVIAVCDDGTMWISEVGTNPAWLPIQGPPDAPPGKATRRTLRL